MRREGDQRVRIFFPLLRLAEDVVRFDCAANAEITRPPVFAPAKLKGTWKVCEPESGNNPQWDVCGFTFLCIYCKIGHMDIQNAIKLKMMAGIGIVVFFVILGESCWASCSSCGALRNAIRDIVSGMQSFYAEPFAATPQHLAIQSALNRLERIWERASAILLTTRCPCRVDATRFSMDGYTFLGTVLELRKSVPSGEGALPSELPLDALLEHLAPPLQFKDWLISGLDWSTPFIVSQWRLFDTLSYSCSAFSNLSSAAAQNSSRALCQTTSKETLQALPGIFSELSHNFQSISRTLSGLLEQRTKAEIQTLRKMFDANFLDRTTPLLRSEDGRPVAQILGDVSRTFFVQSGEKKFSYPVQTETWLPQSMTYQKEKNEIQVRQNPKTEMICAPLLFRDLPHPKEVCVSVQNLQTEIDYHQDLAQKNLHAVIESFEICDLCALHNH